MNADKKRSRRLLFISVAARYGISCVGYRCEVQTNANAAHHYLLFYFIDWLGDVTRTWVCLASNKSRSFAVQLNSFVDIHFRVEHRNKNCFFTLISCTNKNRSVHDGSGLAFHVSVFRSSIFEMGKKLSHRNRLKFFFADTKSTQEISRKRFNIHGKEQQTNRLLCRVQSNRDKL